MAAMTTPVDVNAAPDEMLRLFQEHGPALVRFCGSFGGGAADAEDIVQDTFIKLL